MPITPMRNVARYGHAYDSSRRYTFPVSMSGAGGALTASRSFLGLRFFDRRDVDLHEAELAEHVHRAHDRLVGRAPIGAHRDRPGAVGARYLEDRRAQRV